MKLYSYWRSSTAYRVRIALNLKGLDYEIQPVDLLAGEQTAPDYSAINPGQGVPSLVLDDGSVLTQSMAILDWLEETFPKPALLPDNPVDRAHLRAAALIIATDIHPVNNTRVIKKLKSLGHTPEEATDWMCHWMARGFTAFQSLIRKDTLFCFGGTPSLADVCLVPQIYNAHRWGVDMAPFERLADIEVRCLALPEFDAARPEKQPDMD